VVPEVEAKDSNRTLPATVPATVQFNGGAAVTFCSEDFAQGLQAHIFERKNTFKAASANDTKEQVV
jgi:hypothetical protein